MLEESEDFPEGSTRGHQGPFIYQCQRIQYHTIFKENETYKCGKEILAVGVERGDLSVSLQDVLEKHKTSHRTQGLTLRT